jgi:uncharacterized protein
MTFIGGQPFGFAKDKIFPADCSPKSSTKGGFVSQASVSPSKVIALEEHILTPAFLEASASIRDRAPVSPYVQKLHAQLLDIGEQRIAAMDEGGIDLQVLSLAGSGLDKLDPGTGTAMARDTNDVIAAAARKYPSRFAGFATLALQAPESAAQELERAIHQLGFKGALIHGTVNGAFLDDPKFTPFWAAAQQLEVPIYLHPAPPPEPVRTAYYSDLPGDLSFFLASAGWGWHVETGMHALRLIVSGLFDKFPRLKLILGHMGENLPFSLVRADQVLSRGASHLERRVAEYFHQHFWITTSGYFSVPPLLCALQVVGADKILFAVDYPFSNNKVARDFLDSAPLSPDDRSRIASGNARKLLQLQE